MTTIPVDRESRSPATSDQGQSISLPYPLLLVRTKFNLAEFYLWSLARNLMCNARVLVLESARSSAPLNHPDYWKQQ